MTKKEWERRFLKGLKTLSHEERNKILEYYREMYGDKAEAGLSEEEILREFGAPEYCAAKMIAENYENRGTEQDFPPNRSERNEIGGCARPWSVAETVGMFFLTLILILPLAIVALVLIVTFGALCITGAILSVVGVIYTVVSPFLTIGSIGGAAVVAHIAAGIILCGVGALLFVVFFLLAKYTALWSGKALQFIYIRRNYR